jgi:hypothetical protein
MADHFDQTNHSDLPLIENDAYTGGLHPRPRASEEFGVRTAGAQGLD